MSNYKISKSGFPKEQGLYDPQNEHENCGFGFIANIKNEPKHEIVHQALEIVHNLDHRGAVGADPLAGDGAGILIQVPDDFFRKEFEASNINLPELGQYGVGIVFLPSD
jgi:glutamate synthase (NADPH/NADH) large chain